MHHGIVANKEGADIETIGILSAYDVNIGEVKNLCQFMFHPRKYRIIRIPLCILDDFSMNKMRP
jgi:hypothetical protein